jgi:hypothetical protein
MSGIQPMTPRNLVDGHPRPERLRNNPRLRLIRPTPTAPAIASTHRQNLHWSSHGEPPSRTSQEAPIPDHNAGQKVGSEQRLHKTATACERDRYPEGPRRGALPDHSAAPGAGFPRQRRAQPGGRKGRVAWLGSQAGATGLRGVPGPGAPGFAQF